MKIRAQIKVNERWTGYCNSAQAIFTFIVHSLLLTNFHDHFIERNFEPCQEIETVRVVRTETCFSEIDDVEDSDQVVAGDIRNDQDQELVLAMARISK